MKLTIILMDKQQREVKRIDTADELARKVGYAAIIQHEGKFYTYSKFKQLGSAEFRECEPPLEV